jgi:hypothetical protein
MNRAVTTIITSLRGINFQNNNQTQKFANSTCYDCACSEYAEVYDPACLALLPTNNSRGSFYGGRDARSAGLGPGLNVE